MDQCNGLRSFLLSGLLGFVNKVSEKAQGIVGDLAGLSPGATAAEDQGLGAGRAAMRPMPTPGYHAA